MKKSDLAKYEGQLAQEANRLTEDLQGIGTFNAETNLWEAMPVSQDGPESDMLDLADRIEDFEGRSEMVKTLAKRLTDIQDAIVKIQNNSFGVCEVCNSSIEIDRLDANPAARTCKTHINN